MSDSMKFKLESMQGKTWMINGTNHKLNNFHINGEAVYISTDSKLFIKDKNEAEDFLKSFLPVETSKPAKEIVKFDNRNITDIRSTLIDTIEKIKTDDQYIKKANAINLTVNTLLNTYKTELILRKQLK